MGQSVVVKFYFISQKDTVQIPRPLLVLLIRKIIKTLHSQTPLSQLFYFYVAKWYRRKTFDNVIHVLFVLMHGIYCVMILWMSLGLYGLLSNSRFFFNFQETQLGSETSTSAS